MPYNYNNFLRPLSTTDRFIQIIASDGNVKYTINPFSVINLLVSNNLVKINLKSDKIITLDFYNTLQAKSAIAQIQDQIDTLTIKVPLLVNKDVQNYVDDRLVVDDLGRLSLNRDLTSGNIYIDGDHSLRFTNHSFTASENILIRAWSGSGPLSATPSIFENTDFERARVSFTMDEPEKSSLNLSTFDWTTATSSIEYQLKFYEGNLILPSDGDILRNGQSVLSKYSATSSTQLQIPNVGQVVILQTENKLAYKTFQSVIAYSSLVNNYYDDEYVLDEGPAYFIGEVDSYDYVSGTLSLLVTEQYGYGLTGVSGSVPTYSLWWLNLTGRSTGDSVNLSSLNGDLIPATNSTYNLGSVDYQWRSLYVATSSIYIGGVTISSSGDSVVFNSVKINGATISSSGDSLVFNSVKINGATISSHDGSIVVNSINLGDIQNPVILRNDEGSMVFDGDPVTKYSATSSTPLQLPDIDQMVTLTTSRNLAYKPMQQVSVYNVAYNGYMVDDYIEDDSVFFTGQVSGYVSGPTAGYLDVVVNYSSGFGLTNSDNLVPTYSFWNIDISPTTFGQSTLLITNPVANGIVLSDGTNNNINVTSDITYDGSTFSVNASIKLLGQTQFQQTVEVVNSSTASATIDYDFNLGSIWYHNDLVSDYNANFINVPESRGVITTTIVISQGATAYSPTSLTINGVTHSIKWSNATPPTVTPNQTDIVALSFVSTNSSFVEILGNISTFG